jgi:hypothetical protein
MYKPSTFIVIIYFLTELATKVTSNINSVEVHPRLSNKQASSEWCTGGCWFTMAPEESKNQMVTPTHKRCTKFQRCEVALRYAY